MTLLSSASIFLLFPVFQCLKVPIGECFSYKLNYAPHGWIWVSETAKMNRTVAVSGTYDCNPEQWSFLRKNCSSKFLGHLRMYLKSTGRQSISIGINFVSKVFILNVHGFETSKLFVMEKDAANFFMQISLPSSLIREKIKAYFSINGDEHYIYSNANHGLSHKVFDRVKVYRSEFLRVTHIQCEKLGARNTECELEKLVDDNDRHRCISDATIFKYTTMSESVF